METLCRDGIFRLETERRKLVAQVAILCQVDDMDVGDSAPQPPKMPPPLPQGPSEPPSIPKEVPSSPLIPVAPVVVSRRWIRQAVWGWLMTAVSLLLLIYTVGTFLDGVIGGKVNFFNPQQIVLYLMPQAVATLVLGLVGTLFGWYALSQLRKAKGQRRGLFGALVSALSWPMLLLTIFGLMVPAGMLTGFLERQGTSVGPTLMFGALGLSVVLDLVLLMVFSRWGASLKQAQAELAPGEKLAIRHKPTLVALGTFLHFAGAIVLAGFYIAYIGSAAEKQRNQPMEGFEETEVLPQGEPLPEPVTDERVQPAPTSLIVGAELKPGEHLQSHQVLYPRKEAVTELRMTFWSNGVPVDLPQLSFQTKFATVPEDGVKADWELRLDKDGIHYVLGAPKLVPAPGGVVLSEVTLAMPEGLGLVQVQDGGMLPVQSRPIGPTRRWLFLSSHDAQVGAKLNAEWGVSLDFNSSSTP